MSMERSVQAVSLALNNLRSNGVFDHFAPKQPGFPEDINESLSTNYKLGQEIISFLTQPVIAQSVVALFDAKYEKLQQKYGNDIRLQDFLAIAIPATIEVAKFVGKSGSVSFEEIKKSSNLVDMLDFDCIPLLGIGTSNNLPQQWFSLNPTLNDFTALDNRALYITTLGDIAASSNPNSIKLTPSFFPLRRARGKNDILRGFTVQNTVTPQIAIRVIPQAA